MANVYSRTLRRAAQILGGEDKLASHLRITPTDLALWIQGTGVPPSDVFLQAVDLVTAKGVSDLLAPKNP
jgi:hypothetical protein